jgi:hypothetical protein
MMPRRLSSRWWGSSNRPFEDQEGRGRAVGGEQDGHGPVLRRAFGCSIGRVLRKRSRRPPDSHRRRARRSVPAFVGSLTPSTKPDEPDALSKEPRTYAPFHLMISVRFSQIA